ncbi:ubiquitin carboxyl-terminal hydrolase 2 [Trichonephila inaurata madagascariensis]|uniref:Ubiquitin carboxyl-terminal hydrolase n=1 Tax=Trichonephila inaurata madagascariensis TaxID=2747483 RepID=A0A8X7CCT1_9ARAC|nr:ubiquitin carboxyl-terminal hydrolase 2 [Trichonephila inaurata madagascariensis]
MSPYNAYSPSLSSSRLSSYTLTPRSYTGSDSYSSLSSTYNYRYKPPAYSSTLSLKYRSPSSYSLNNSYTPSTLPRNASSSSFSARVPKFNSVSSYTSAILNTSDYKWKSSTTTTNDLLWRSPSLSRRNSSSSLVSSSHALERNSRLSLPAYTSSIEKTPTYKVNSWSCDKSDDVEERRGVRVGLNNLGNTCFMNAVLQCLCHTQPLVDYCMQGTYLSDINHRSPTHGDLVKVFADFVKKISDSNSKGAISPYQLRTEVQRYAPRFSGDHQQDAQEFLRYLLQGLHDDINRIKYKPSLKGDFGGDAFKTWRRYKNTDDSLIVDLFAGQLKSTLKCMSCSNDSITYDPFWDLSLPIPEGYRPSTLRQCFNLFSSPEILDGSNKPYCEVCKKKTRSNKKIEVNKLPKVLVIPTSYGQKLSMMIDCPMTLGNISEFTSQNSIGDNYSYVLYGVVDHDGSNNSGHYIAKCRNPYTKEWNEFNDSRVTKATNIVTNKSYILFYIQEGGSYL